MERVSIEEFDMEKTEGKQTVRLDIFSLFDDSPVSLPCGIISNGNERKVCVLSGQHGNEWNGIYASQNYFKRINPEEVSGTLVVLPVTNPLAYNEKSRVSSIDHIDLNRTFLKKDCSKPTEYLGRILFDKIFSEMEYIVDIHGGGPGEYSPHVAVVDEKNVDKASSFLLPDVYVETKTDGSLAAASNKCDFENFTIEAGRQRYIDYDHVGEIFEGLDNFLKAADILDGESKDNEVKVYRDKKKVSSPVSGFFRPEVELGDYIEEGEEVGTVEKIFDGERPVKSSHSGMILYLRREGVIGRGENLIHIVN